MIAHLRFLCAALLASLAGVAAAADGTTPVPAVADVAAPADVHGSGNRRFAAHFPSAPKMEEGAPGNELLGTTSWKYVDDSVMFEVTVMEARKPLTPEERAQTLASMVGQLTAPHEGMQLDAPRVTDVDVGGVRGRDVTATAMGKLHFRARVVVLEHAAYLVLAASKPLDDAQAQRAVDAFIASFRPQP